MKVTGKIKCVDIEKVKGKNGIKFGYMCKFSVLSEHLFLEKTPKEEIILAVTFKHFKVGKEYSIIIDES